MQVKKSTQGMVNPATPSPGGMMELTNMDQIIPRIYTSLLLFFQEKPADEASALLKCSLAETLSLFYPLAGRYRERINGELEIVCNDQGASFHEVWVDCGFDSLLPNFDTGHPQFALLTPQLDVSANVSEIPLLLVQITHFECGRICLGIRFHHNVCDGFSTSHFLSYWAILARAKVRTGELSAIIKPHLDRSVLRANNPPSPTATTDHPEYQLITHDTPNLSSIWRPHSGTSKIFRFTPSSLNDLMAKAGSDVVTPTHTRFEALAAHLWRGIIHSRDLAPSQEIRLGMPVNGRKRFNPPLPAGYFGNVVLNGYTAYCKAGDLVGSPLSFAADLVKTAIAKVDDAHMRSALDWVAKQESAKLVISAFADLGISSWWTFPFYDVDFGWGKPS